MNKLLVTSLLVLFTAGAAADDLNTRMRSVEEGHEFEAAALRLPSDGIGNLDIKVCQECTAEKMVIDANTRFFIGADAVTIGDLRAYMDAHPAKSILVVTPVGKNLVLRIKVTGVVKR